MKTKSRVKISDIGKNPGEPLANITGKDLMPLPYPCNDFNHPGTGKLTEDQKNRYETSFDGTIAVAIPKPQSKAEEDELVANGEVLRNLKTMYLLNRSTSSIRNASSDSREARATLRYESSGL